MDLTTFALLNVGDSWVYGPLWGNFRQLHPQVYMDCAICLFTFDFLLMNKRFRRYTGVWLIQQGTTPLLDTRSLSWGFLLGFWWCLTSESRSQGLSSCQQWCSEDRESSQTFESCMPKQKVQTQESIKGKLVLKAALARRHATILGHCLHDRGNLQGWQDEEIKNTL